MHHSVIAAALIATYDLVVVGAGPVGVSTAIHAQRRGLRVALLDRGPVANHLLDFPVGMPFFTPRHSLELMGIPLDSGRGHAVREELISYYQRMARLAGLELHTGVRFEDLEGAHGDFEARARRGDGATTTYRCRNLVLATGVFGQPRRLDPIPGATHAKVHYRYREPFAFAGQRVALVGAGNSSAGAALALHHAGAQVTVLDRNAAIPALKWRWHFDDLQRLIRGGAIEVVHRARLARIDDAAITVDVDGAPRTIANDAVFVQLGYHPDVGLFDRLGLAYDAASQQPQLDTHTLESSRRGVFLAGIACAGSSPDRVFVWGARHHPKAIVARIVGEAPPAGLDDLDATTIAHWAQFEKLDEPVDEALALRMVPVLTGELGDDAFDIYEHATGSTHLYADAPSAERRAPASLFDALDGWLVQRNADGSIVFKGQRFSADAAEILQRCDGSRRIADIVDELAEAFEQPADELRGLVLSLLLPLLRAGKLTWRAAPLARLAH